eukprot:m.281102 g.281102  ORF g.281102 m.281102 type:complete len:133 (+) comp16327_c0_seq1:1771-2169(+)
MGIKTKPRRSGACLFAPLFLEGNWLACVHVLNATKDTFAQSLWAKELTSLLSKRVNTMSSPHQILENRILIDISAIVDKEPENNRDIPIKSLSQHVIASAYDALAVQGLVAEIDTDDDDESDSDAPSFWDLE